MSDTRVLGGLVKIYFSIALLAILSFGAGCASSPLDLDFNPFYQSQPHAGDGSHDSRSVIPFYFSSESEQSSTWGVRPLFSIRHNDRQFIDECLFLPPLGRYTTDGNRTKFHIWPFYWYTKTLHSGEGEDVDWMFLILLFGGRSHDGEDYFAFFPFGGHICHFLTFQTFDFVLWPLYQRTVSATQDPSTSHCFLFLYGWTDGGRRDGSFMFLPFYMHRTWEGKYDKYSVLFPFFHYQENRLDTRNPSTLYSFWPLFTHESSDILSRWGFIGPVFFLGPLIQICSETPEMWEGEPNEEGHSWYLYDVPWPLVRIEKTKDHEYFRILPFYSNYVRDDFESTAWLIPFFWHRKAMLEAYEKEDFFFVPFFQSTTVTYADEAGMDSYLQVWPLFHNTDCENGTRDLSILSLIPMRNEYYVGGIEDLFAPFWNIYRYQRTPSGAEKHSALLGLINAYNAPDETRFSFPLLYSYHRTHDIQWRHDFLLGLFSLGGDDEGLKKLRFLFIPFLDS